MKRDGRTRFQRIGIDIIGVLLIIASGLAGWIPGPGGLPLFFGGLGLLASNHEWAERIFVEIKGRGNSIADFMFRDHPVLVLAYDIAATALVITGAIIVGAATKNIFITIGIIAFFLGISIFLGNKKRFQRLSNWVKSKR